jgi:GTPase SAR1 family protein
MHLNVRGNGSNSDNYPIDDWREIERYASAYIRKSNGIILVIDVHNNKSLGKESKEFD